MSIIYSKNIGTVTAKVYYDMGYSVYKETSEELLQNPTDSEIAWKLYPAGVVISFACEILLKLLYEKEKKASVSGHLLYRDVYSQLSKDTQQSIMAATRVMMATDNMGSLSDADFIDTLKKSENTFQNERYLYELKSRAEHGVKIGFLIAFAKALMLLTKDLNNKVVVEESEQN